MNGKVLNKEALKAWILSKVVTLTNNLLATTPGVSAMDAAQGPVIQGQIDAINSNLGGLSFGETEDGQPGFRKPGADTVIPFKQVDSGSGNVSSSAYYRIELGYRPKYFAGYAKNNSGGQGLGAFIFVDGASYQAENFWRIDDTGVTFSGHNWFYGVPILWISAK